MKKDYVIILNTISLVKDFVSLTSRLSGDISIHSGKYIIDGKSILGIFSIDLTRELNCTLEGTAEDIEIFETGLKTMKLI